VGREIRDLPGCQYSLYFSLFLLYELAIMHRLTVYKHDDLLLLLVEQGTHRPYRPAIPLLLDGFLGLRKFS
jgi:hypothetical protein